MNASSPEERRKYSRVEFDAEAVIEQENKRFPAKVIDVSLNGLLVETPSDYHLRADIPCSAQIRLSESTSINMQAMLVHSGTVLLGFQCSSIDMDSIIHLRRLIELNIGDTQASDRALAELMQHQPPSAGE